MIVGVMRHSYRGTAALYSDALGSYLRSQDEAGRRRLGDCGDYGHFKRLLHNTHIYHYPLTKSS
jgi:hypothetical protein